MLISIKLIKGGVHIKKILRCLNMLCIAVFAVFYTAIEAGGDSKSYTISVNDEIVSAYSNGEDVTDDFIQAEEQAREAIIERFQDHEVEFYDFCHLGGTLNMTIDIGVDDKEFYTVGWHEKRVSGMHELDRDYVEKWYKLD